MVPFINSLDCYTAALLALYLLLRLSVSRRLLILNVKDTMQIFVRIVYDRSQKWPSKTISLEVEPEDEIQNVVSSILKKEKVPKSSHKIKLTFGGKKLRKKKCTLSKYKIQEESILCCSLVAKIIRTSIVLYGENGWRLDVEVRLCDTIEEVKAKIQAKFNIPIKQQWLFFSGEPLENQKTVSDYNIQSCSVFHLMLKLHNGRQVFTRTPSGKTITLDVRSSDSIDDVKAMIEHVERIPPDRQQLIFPHSDMDATTPGIDPLLDSTVNLIVSGSMQVSLKLSYETITLDVEPNDTVYSVKLRIQVQHGIPISQQQLTFANQLLENDKTLSDYNVECGSVIELEHQVLPGYFPICIHTLTRRKYWLVVQPMYTIEHTMTLIEKCLGVPFDQQRLIFAGRHLENHQTLQECKIARSSVLTLSLRLRGGGGGVFVITPTNETLCVPITISETVQTLKLKIERREGIPADLQCLLFAYQQLQDEMTLNDYGIFSGAHIRLVLKPGEGRMSILAQMPNGKAIALHVKPDETIDSCKKMIERLEVIPSDQQNIVFAGKKLKDSNRLSDYNIPRESLIHVLQINGTVTLHIRGLDHKEVVSLRVDPSDSVLCLKARISAEVPYPPVKQKLLVNDVVMSESRSLNSYSIPPNTTVTLSILKRVFVKIPGGRTLKIKVFPDETVESMKLMIQEKSKVEPSRQQLFYNGLLLEDVRTVASYDLVEDPLIELVNSPPATSFWGWMFGHKRETVVQPVSTLPAATATGGTVSGPLPYQKRPDEDGSSVTNSFGTKLPHTSHHLGGATLLAVDTHLRPVRRAIWDARASWRNIGRALGLSEGTIDSIHEPNDGESLYQVLRQWMQSGNATMPDLLKALDDRTVGRTDIAKEIRALKGERRTEVGL